MSARRVLVVDDDADMSAMLARHLEGEGMAVTAATGGRAALQALASREFDVVVTDLVMDEVGGSHGGRTCAVVEGGYRCDAVRPHPCGGVEQGHRVPPARHGEHHLRPALEGAGYGATDAIHRGRHPVRRLSDGRLNYHS